MIKVKKSLIDYQWKFKILDRLNINSEAHENIIFRWEGRSIEVEETKNFYEFSTCKFLGVYRLRMDLKILIEKSCLIFLRWLKHPTALCEESIGDSLDPVNKSHYDLKDPWKWLLDGSSRCPFYSIRTKNCHYLYLDSHCCNRHFVNSMSEEEEKDL